MHNLPILGIVATGSNAGKTTLITALIPILAQKNIRVSVIKHAHHRFDIDYPGKDSYLIREAGAVQTLVASSQRWALMTELKALPDTAPETDLNQLISQISVQFADLILVEGFKGAPIAKIEVHRAGQNSTPLAYTDDTIIAVATDTALDLTIPVLNLNDPAQIAQFILDSVIQS